MVSLVGTWMQTVAQNWLVYRLTGSPAQLGLIGFAGQIPVFLLSPIGGAVADRFDRPRVLLCYQAAAGLLALLLAVLTLTERVEIWHVFVLALLFGVVFAFDVPARHALIAEMVDKSDMTNAIALNSSMVNGTRIIGPAIAGLTVAAIGEGWCFLLNAISYLALIASLFAMKLTAPAEHADEGSALRSIMEGFQFVARTAPIRALLLLVALSSVMGLPYTVLMPIFADQILQGGASGYGVLMATSGAGALIGALTLANRTERPRSRNVGCRCHRRVRSQPDLVLGFASLLALCTAPGARWVFSDGATCRVDHTDSGNGAKSTAGSSHGSLFNDVFWHGTIWRARVWDAGRAARRTGDRCPGRIDLRAGLGGVRCTVAGAARGGTPAHRRAGVGGRRSACRSARPGTWSAHRRTLALLTFQFGYPPPIEDE